MFPNLRRTAALAASVTVAALVAVAPAPANAADSPTLWRPGQAPAGVGFWSDNCSDNGAHTKLADDPLGFEQGATLTSNDADGGVAWTLHPAATTEGGPAVKITGAAIATITSISIDVSGPATGKLVGYYLSDSGKANHGVAAVSTATGWHSADAGASLAWDDGLLLGIRASKSLQDFVKNKTSGTLLLGYEFGCSTTPVAIDHLKLTTTAGTTDYDFTNRTSRTTLILDRTSVTGDGTVSLTGEVSDSTGAAVTDGTVAVMAQPEGAAAFTQVGPTVAPGASVEVTPTTRTTYRLDYSGGLAAGPSSSSSATVTVRPQITMTANKTVSRIGKVVNLRGTTAPARAGVPVTIQRKQGSKWKKVARSVTDDAGAYAVKVTPDSGGTWQLRAQLAASAGNASATSPARKVTVQTPTRISAKVQPGKVLLGKRYAVVGKAKGAKKGTRVRLQVKVGKKWATIAQTRLSRKLTYRIRPKSATVGRFVLRTVLSRSGARLGSHSGRVRLRVTAPPSRSPSTTPTSPPTHHESPPSGGVGHG